MSLRNAIPMGAVSILVAAVCWYAMDARSPRVVSVQHAGPTIDQIRSWSTLVTTRVYLADAVTADVSGFGGSVTALIVARGDAWIGVDLSRAELVRFDASARYLILILPQPVPQQARLDHEHTRVVAVQRHGVWMFMRRDQASQQAIDAAYASAQRAIEKAATDTFMIEQARQRTCEVIGSLLAQSGWTADIRWK